MISSTNEWGTLRQVIVGRADHARVPETDLSMRCVNYADKLNCDDVVVGPYPAQVIEEANEDLEQFVSVLENNGVEVLRPSINKPNYYNYCPRDSVVVYGNQTFAAPMPVRARRHEWQAFAQHLENTTDLSMEFGDSLYNTNCIGDADTLALCENYASFDAANIIRADQDLLYLVSNTGNRQGAQLLERVLPSGVRLHLLENVYSYAHIDSTVAFLRPGLMLINPSRIRDLSLQLPRAFDDWQKITCPEPVDIGHWPGYNNASKWINMNLFSISPNHVVVEQHQTGLCDLLDHHGFEVTALPMRHQRTLGGGFHCVTLDTHRD